MTYAISIVKWFFEFFTKKILYTFIWKYCILLFAEFELLMFHNDIVKLSE